MDAAAIINRLKESFGDRITQVSASTAAPLPDPWFEVDRKDLRELAGFLKDDPSLDMDLLSCISAVDYRTYGAGKIKDVSPRFEVVYHLESVAHLHTIVMKVRLAIEDPKLPTVSDLWAGANWHEREAWDLMGIEFEGHPELTRILCAEDWVGHPLRKDYQFPVEYHGVPHRYGERLTQDPRWV